MLNYVLHKCHTSDLNSGIQKKLLDKDRGIALTPIAIRCY